jgi:dTDP-4-amino-4,6-dideoxygalactose transaminase
MPEFLPFTRPTIDEDMIGAIAQVLRSGWITTGPQVQGLENELAAYLGGAREVRVLTSATGALEIALKVAGIGPGDEVLVPAMTFAASANVVLRLGASVRFVDVGVRSRNASAAQFEQAIGPRTRALMPVHFAGLAVDMDPVNALAKKHGLRVVEDAAHAIGTSYHSRRIGSFGDLVCFSFHPNKNMTTVEGGAIVYGDAALSAPIELERWHGISKDADGQVDVQSAGGKYNLTDVAASLGRAQLRRLEEFNGMRRKLIARYFERLEPRLPADWLPERGDQGHSWHIFAPLLPFSTLGYSRLDFIQKMKNRGIGVGIHYPAVPALSLYRKLGHDPAQYPNAARIGAQTVTLPLFPLMTEGDVDRVCDALLELTGR